MLSEPELIAIIERSFFMMPMVPNRMMATDLPGVTGRYCGIPHPFANTVGLSTLSEDEVEAAIAATVSFFAERNLAFSWITGPISLPESLPAKLTAAGLVPGVEMAGLVLRDITALFPHDPAVRVREVGPEASADIAQVASLGFGFPKALGEIIVEAYNMPGKARIRNYLAYAPGSETPGSFASTMYIPDTSVVLLAGAATLPEARGQGLYSALVARRLQDAVADGKTTAIIQAVRTTSAPILMKRGFEEVCGLTMWIGGMPQGEAAPDIHA